MRRTQNRSGFVIRHHREKTEHGRNLDLTLDKYFETWIARRYATAAKKSTPYRYEHWYCNHIKKELGDYPLGTFTRSDILEFQAELAAHCTPSTVNYTIQLLKNILSDAAAEELLPRNPAVRIRPIKEPVASAASEKHRALTLDEQKRFMQAARNSFYYEFFAILLLTGLRHGEAAALVWDDVDYERNVIHITKSLTFDESGRVIIGTPKSEAGIRDVPINDQIRNILEKQHEKTAALLSDEEFNAEGMPLGQHRVFYPRPHPEGVLHNRTANLALQKILDDMEKQGDPIKPFSLHAMRDTFATRFIEQGGSPQTLKTILGHSSLAMTMDLYSHVLSSTKQQEMDRVKIEI